MPQPDLAAVTQLVDAQALIKRRIGNSTSARVRDLLDAFTGWYDTKAVDKLAAEIAAIVSGQQKVVANTTDAYMTRASGLVAGRVIGSAGAIDTSRLRAGTTPDRVYGRLAKQYRYLESKQQPPERALKTVTARSTAMVNTDIQLASRAQSQKTMEHQGIQSWRRVIHPELSKGGTCGLCLVASDRIYHVKQLMPIHDGCWCEPLMIVGDVDPGHSLNEADLKQIYAEAGSTGADDLKRVQYKVHHHGELGPILTNTRYDWRSPEDVAA